jgi:hypothetical protein
MKTTSKLIALYNQFEWLSNLYTAVVNKQDEEDLIQELRAETNAVYSEIISIKTKSNYKNANQQVRRNVHARPNTTFKRKTSPKSTSTNPLRQLIQS